MGIKEYFLINFSQAEAAKAQLLAIIRLRWLLLTLYVFLAPLGLVAGYIRPDMIIAYSGVLSLFFVFNLLNHWFWSERQRSVTDILLFFQLATDLLVFVFLLLISGGLANPIYIIFYIYIGLSAILLTGFSSLAFLILGHQFLLILQMVSALAGSDLSIIAFFQPMAIDMGPTPLAFMGLQHGLLFLSWMIHRAIGYSLSNQQEKLLQIQQFTAKMDRLKSIGAMAAGFSHEFASPLNTIKLRLEREIRQRQLKTDSAQTTVDNLSEMQMALIDCQRILKQMNSSQMDPRDFRFESCVLSELTKEIVNSWRAENPTADVDLDLKGTSDFQTSSQHLKMSLPRLNYAQALINILDNAFEANSLGKIRIQIFYENHKIEICIQNEGSSFDEEVLKKFGEPFLTTKKNGIGLGLYSVLLFAESVGGWAELANSTGGAIVKVILPMVLQPSREQAL